ncbi:Myb-like_DNA-binding domain-containing protein [Hexamita inflata]|uniref:Myb-like_DNA-binding domain-containing protein n=1 Tax=Hexamita inflata TaxID=28002 RepID=A0ABP1HLM0_9EUKA
MSVNYQRSDVNCLQWSQADILLLINAHKLQGSNWIYICQHYFPNRSANQVQVQLSGKKRSKGIRTYNSRAVFVCSQSTAGRR